MPLHPLSEFENERRSRKKSGFHAAAGNEPDVLRTKIEDDQGIAHWPIMALQPNVQKQSIFYS